VVRSPAITRTICCCEFVSYQLVSNELVAAVGAGVFRAREATQLAAKPRVTVPATSEYSGRAAVFREELQLQ
jgi:hypothetical protein